jgi:hypothetical protein
VQNGWICDMFSYLKSLFSKNKKQTYKYVLFQKGKAIAMANEKEMLEKHMKDMFKNADTKIDSHGTSKTGRWNLFKSNFCIKEMCDNCGKQVGYCGQC